MADQNPTSHTRDFSGVLDREWAHVKAIRGHTSDEKRKSLIGLSISGGGIRSASFGLGVMQAFVAKEIMGEPTKSPMMKFDYLSTVSGGGYIGSALTWLLSASPNYGLDREHFPLRGPHHGTRQDAEAESSEAPPALDFIRQRGNFLTPGQYLNVVSMIAVVLRGMLSTFLVYFVLLTALFYAGRCAGLFDAFDLGVVKSIFGGAEGGAVSRWLEGHAIPCCTSATGAGTGAASLPALNIILWLAVIAAGFFAIVALVYALWTTFGANRRSGLYHWRTRAQYVQGWLLVAGLVFLVVGSLPLVEHALNSAVQTATVSTILGTIGAIAKFMWDSRSGDSAKGPFGKTLIILTTILLAYGTLLLSFSTAVSIMDAGLSNAIVIIVAIAAAFVGFYTNFNYTSPHRMYRDRLMETFLPDLGAIIKTEWQPASRADATPLHQMCGAGGPAPARYPGPYHIINANIVLVNSQNLKFRDRGSDNFILSPLHCGSDATGWIKTSDYIARPKLMPRGRPITLASAMSISGAAANPHTGGAGGLARNAIVSFLMTMMNLRLGYMEINPDERKHRAFLPKRPNLFLPGVGELFSTGFTEGSHFIELTDGGHFENMGIYELIRRKMSVIVATDSGADDNYAFADLSNAIERVRVDFGVNISFRDDFDLRHVVPGSDSVNSALHENIRFATRGYAIANIRYADGISNGILIVIKPTLISGLPADLYGYKIAETTFPQQTTADQFFDEAQFESYRELGYQLTKRLLGDDVPRGFLGLPKEGTGPQAGR